VTAIFVTATGTDVGKTFVTTGLIRHLRAQGRKVDAIKPVVSGFDPDHAAAADPGVLLRALGRPVELAEIARMSPWRFRAPLAPDLAAAREDRSVEFNKLIEFSRQSIAAASDTLFIEGVGGIMVPLDDRHTVLDWMTVLRIPALLVTGSYLGTISHTLTALHVLAQRNVEVSAIVVSETSGSSVTLPDTITTIARFAVPIEVIGIPRVPHPDLADPAFRQLATLL
jgi:dethiobiotin synthetase